MANFYDEFNSVFWLSLATMILGSIGICLRYAYMSKCSQVEICCMKIVRDTHAEMEIDEQNHGEEKQEEGINV